MNGHKMENVHFIDRAVVDSGTTFVYVPERLFKILMDHFDWFCLIDPAKHCKGKRLHTSNQNPNTICFEYNEKKNPSGPKDYFLTYPILQFQVPTDNGTT